MIGTMSNMLAPMAGLYAATKGAKNTAEAMLDKKKSREELAKMSSTQERERNAALLAMLGNKESEDDEDEEEAPTNETEINISTAPGKLDEDELYRITSDTGEDDEVPEFNLADLVGEEAAKGMMMALPVGDEGPKSKPVGNTSVADMASMKQEAKTKSPLIDETIGARPAGIPMETLSALFSKTHGGSFDPNSKVDRQKMNVIRDMIQEDKSLLGLSPAKFAMKVYARK